MKIIFFGSDDFACQHMQALINSKHQVVACVTQPDKAKGRGMEIVLSPIKELGMKNNIPVLQPERIKDLQVACELKDFNADIFVVIAYGKFLPKEILKIPKFTPINVHGSILPKLRGAGPINWAIINGEIETGITVAEINEKMDSGNILQTAKVSIDEKDDGVTLRKKMLAVSPGVLIEAIDLIEQGRVKKISQDESKATFAPKLTKEMGNIDWTKSAVEINNLVRGLLPWPHAYTFYEGKMIRIHSSEAVTHENKGRPGEVICVNKEHLIVQTGKGALLIKEVHLQDSKRMSVKDFLLGRKISAGFQFKNK